MKDFNKRLDDIQKQLVVKQIISQMKDKKDVILIEKEEDGKSKVTMNGQEYIVSDANSFIEAHKEKIQRTYKKYEPQIIDLDIPIYQIMLALGMTKERMQEVLRQGDTTTLLQEYFDLMKEYANKDESEDN